MDHQAVRDGWPHDDAGNPYLRDYGAGTAVCSCGWVSLTHRSAIDRRAAISRHAARATAMEALNPPPKESPRA